MNMLFEKIRFDCQHDGCLLLDTISQLSDKVLCFLSLRERKIIKISNSPYLLGAKSPTDICGMGYRFFESILPPEDYSFLISIHSSFESFLDHTCDYEDRLNYNLSYNVVMRTDTDNLITINHQLSPMDLSSNPTYLCVISIAAIPERFLGIIRHKKENSRWEYIEKRWRKKETIKYLSAQEKLIVIYTHQGFSTKEISEIMYKSESRIKDIRNGLIRKLSLSNMTQVISYVRLHHLI